MYTLMADVLVRNDRRDKAIEALNKGIEKNPSKVAKAQILWHLANLYLDTRQRGRRRHRHRQRHRLHAADARIPVFLARANRFSRSPRALRQRRLEIGPRGFEKVRPRLNDFPQLMKCLDYWIGYCYLQQGNPDQAMAAFRRSLSFDKFYFKARDGIAQIFLAKGEFKDAVEEYRLRSAGNPSDADAWLAFAKTLVPRTSAAAPRAGMGEVGPCSSGPRNSIPAEGQIKLLIAEILVARGKVVDAEGLITSSAKIRPRA